MILDDLNHEVEKKLGIKFNISESYGHKSGYEWVKAHVIVHNSVSLGRIIFRDGKLYSVKRYKNDMRRDICMIDKIFYRLERYFQDRVIIPLGWQHDLEAAARFIVNKDMIIKQQWRASNPKYNTEGIIVPRKRLEGRNPRFVLGGLILNISENSEEFEKSVTTIMNDIYKMKGEFKRTKTTCK